MAVAALRPPLGRPPDALRRGAIPRLMGAPRLVDETADENEVPLTPLRLAALLAALGGALRRADTLPVRAGEATDHMGKGYCSVLRCLTSGAVLYVLGVPSVGAEVVAESPSLAARRARVTTAVLVVEDVLPPRPPRVIARLDGATTPVVRPRLDVRPCGSLVDGPRPPQAEGVLLAPPVIGETGALLVRVIPRRRPLRTQRLVA